jgi:hypothetical protein
LYCNEHDAEAPDPDNVHEPGAVNIPELFELVKLTVPVGVDGVLPVSVTVAVQFV